MSKIFVLKYFTQYYDDVTIDIVAASHDRSVLEKIKNDSDVKSLAYKESYRIWEAEKNRIAEEYLWTETQAFKRINLNIQTPVGVSEEKYNKYKQDLCKKEINDILTYLKCWDGDKDIAPYIEFLFDSKLATKPFPAIAAFPKQKIEYDVFGYGNLGLTIDEVDLI